MIIYGLGYLTVDVTMLNSDIEAFRASLNPRDKASIIEIAVENYSRRSNLEARLCVLEQIKAGESKTCGKRIL